MIMRSLIDPIGVFLRLEWNTALCGMEAMQHPWHPIHAFHVRVRLGLAHQLDEVSHFLTGSPFLFFSLLCLLVQSVKTVAKHTESNERNSTQYAEFNPRFDLFGQFIADVERYSFNELSHNHLKSICLFLFQCRQRVGGFNRPLPIITCQDGVHV